MADGVGAFAELHSVNGTVETYQYKPDDIYSIEDTGRIFPMANGSILIRCRMTINGFTGYMETTGRIKNGKLDGVFPCYALIRGENLLLSKTNYENNFRQGPTEVYFLDGGQLKFSIEFNKNIRNGRFLAFYQTGHVLAKAWYKDGVLDGECTTFQDDGREISSGVYANGKERSGSFIRDFEKFISVASTERPIEVALDTVAPDGEITHDGNINVN